MGAALAFLAYAVLGDESVPPCVLVDWCWAPVMLDERTRTVYGIAVEEAFESGGLD